MSKMGSKFYETLELIEQGYSNEEIRAKSGYSLRDDELDEMRDIAEEQYDCDGEPELDDGEVLASAGWGTDEDYGDFSGVEY